jgi:murein DD-endopeptidase MepM/ murein hydrolase activator NlpD
MMRSKDTENGRDVTLMLVPGGNGRVLRVHLSPRRLRHVLLAAAITVTVTTVSLAFSLYSLAGLPEKWMMEEQMLTQRLYLNQLSTRLDEAERTLDRVRRLDRKLRVILGEGADQGDRTVLGVGGPSAGDVDRYDALLDDESRIELARLDLNTDEVGIEAAGQEVRLHDLHALLLDQSVRLDSTPSVWPVRGWVTSGFGVRTSPFTGSRKFHEGIDIAARLGNPVYSTADGMVLFAGAKSGYGKVVFVDHGYGVSTRYGHLSGIDVTAGQRIQRGEIVGRVGSTGRSTGPHLHYEVLVAGVPVNPYSYILLEDEILP